MGYIRSQNLHNTLIGMGVKHLVIWMISKYYIYFETSNNYIISINNKENLSELIKNKNKRVTI